MALPRTYTLDNAARMSGKDWKKVKEIFHEALRLDTGERDHYLDETCAGNIDLRIEVESLLISLTEAKSFLEQPVVKGLPASGEASRLQNGHHISHYRIVSHIATGGMGEVYLAEDEKLRRQVALKVLPEHLLADKDRLRRFKREAHAVSVLNHPNILTIFEVDFDQGINLFASEFVKGVTLRERLDQGRLALTEAIEIAVQIASAMQAAHAAGVIHRDIKPENVMIRDDGYVKVLDFGLAKLTFRLPADPEAETQIRFSQPGMIMGTVTYMSPEQARARSIDERSDIFSLGVVLYEMLTGQPPFTGETNTDVIAAIIQMDPPPVSSVNLEVPSELDAILTKALEKDKLERYQTAADLLADLKSLLKRLEFNAELERTGQPAIAGVSAPSRSDTSHDAGIDDRNTLIGRDSEIEDVTRLLRRTDVRLVTLTGIGGTGKTRLARAVAERLRGEFPGGSAFVELSCVRDPELVASSIAQSLGVPEIGGDAVLETIRNELHEKPVLLILDNFEQVIASAAQIAELIGDLPASKILATSRELLHLTMEIEYPVPPLKVPSIADPLTADESRQFESVVLFEKRARNANPEFSLTDRNASEVAEICARLDGLPLAIELAAARAKILSPAEILEKLDDRLSLLTGGAKDLPDRQRTVRGAIEWSYDLLTADEKDMFRRLSVFAGGFTNSTAESVLLRSGFSATASDVRVSRMSAADNQSIGFLDLLTSLADKSLLVSKGRLNGERRFALLDTVREYGVAALAETDHAKVVHQCHAEFLLELAEKAEPHLKSGDSAAWLSRLEVEHDNIRAALKWTLENAPEMAARLAAAIRHLWAIHGHLYEGRRWSAEILARNTDMPDAIRWKILTGYGNLSQFQGDLENAHALYEESLAVSTRSGDNLQVSQSLRGLAALAYMQSDFSSARDLIERAVALSRETNDVFGLAASLARLGDVASAEGDFTAARSLSGEALRIYRELGYKEGISAKLNNLGAAAFAQGAHEEARACFEEALTTAIELGEKINTRLIFDGFAALAAASGQFQRAAELSGVAESLGASIGYAPEPAELRFRDAYVSKVRAALGDAEFDAAHKAGLKLSLDEATKLTRDDKPVDRPRLEKRSSEVADPVLTVKRPRRFAWWKTSFLHRLQNKKLLIAVVLAAVAAAVAVAFWFLFYNKSGQIDSFRHYARHEFSAANKNVPELLPNSKLANYQIRGVFCSPAGRISTE